MGPHCPPAPFSRSRHACVTFPPRRGSDFPFSVDVLSGLLLWKRAAWGLTPSDGGLCHVSSVMLVFLVQSLPYPAPAATCLPSVSTGLLVKGVS